jgi:hypothetical protein
MASGQEGAIASGISARLTNLELLSQGDTQVTDVGLAHLKGLKGLKCLKLTGTRVTNLGTAELQKSLSQLQAIR